MKSIYDNLGAVISFSIIVLLVQNFIGEKEAEYTVLFTLLGMVLINRNKIIDFLKSWKME